MTTKTKTKKSVIPVLFVIMNFHLLPMSRCPKRQIHITWIWWLRTPWLSIMHESSMWLLYEIYTWDCRGVVTVFYFVDNASQEVVVEELVEGGTTTISMWVTLLVNIILLLVIIICNRMLVPSPVPPNQWVVVKSIHQENIFVPLVH